MKKLMLLLIVGAMLGTSAFAAGTCTSTTLSNLIGFEADGITPFYCNIGELQFSNFAIQGSSGEPSPVAAGNVSMTPTSLARQAGWVISGAPSWNNSSIVLAILFTVAAHPAPIDSISASLTGASGSHTLIGLNVTTTELAPQGLWVENGTPLSGSMGFAQLGQLHVKNTFTISGGSTYPASLQSATVTFGEVPEPVTFVLLGSGLIGLGLLRRRLL